MPIHVICPGCHSRFQVSDKFAGKTGPCPKCKTSLKIPDKSEEVVIHAPDVDGPKDSTGQSVLKPIARKETKISTPLIVGIASAAVAVPLIAFILGRSFLKDDDGNVIASMAILATGAILLAPPLVVAGYSFLRDDELEPYRGRALWIRGLICSAVYAGTWGLYWYLGWMNLYSEPMELFQVLYVLPLLVIPGALASLATLDLEPTSAAFHYCFYLLVTVGLRLIMGLPAL